MKNILLSLFVFTTLLLQAQYPILDPTFNGIGYGIITDTSSSEEALTIKIQNDGKILLAGFKVNISADHDVYLARVNSDGSKDNTFTIYTSHINTFSEFTDMALQSDGKIVVVGKTGTLTNGDILVMRFNSNGTPDNSFDGDGQVIYDLLNTNYDDNTTCVILQNDGKILVGGNSFIRGDYDPFILRLNANGSKDNTFNGSGYYFNPMSDGYDYIKSMDIQSDGKILLAGSSTDSVGDYMFAATRINSSGTIDNTFGASGVFLNGIPGNFNVIRKVLVLSSGKILLVGNSSVGSINNGKPIIIRLLDNGTIDNDYALFGVSSHFAIPKNFVTESAILTTNDDLIMEGYHLSGPGSIEIGVAKIDSDGVAINTFGVNGFKWFSVAGGSNICHDIELQSDGRIVLAGAYKNSTMSHGDMCAIRLSMAGLSIENKMFSTKILVYPNPCKSSIQIKSDELINKIVLINQYGQELIHMDAQNSLEHILSVEEQKSGCYLLQIHTKSGIINKPIIID